MICDVYKSVKCEYCNDYFSGGLVSTDISRCKSKLKYEAQILTPFLGIFKSRLAEKMSFYECHCKWWLLK